MIFSPDFCLFLVPVQNVVRPCQPPRPHTLLVPVVYTNWDKNWKKKVQWHMPRTHPILIYSCPSSSTPRPLDPQLSSIHSSSSRSRPSPRQPSPALPSPRSTPSLLGPLHGVRRATAGGGLRRWAVVRGGAPWAAGGEGSGWRRGGLWRADGRAGAGVGEGGGGRMGGRWQVGGGWREAVAPDFFILFLSFFLEFVFHWICDVFLLEFVIFFLRICDVNIWFEMLLLWFRDT